MPCDIKLQISNYNAESNKVESLLTSIGTIGEDQSLNIDQVAAFIANLDKETRDVLAAQLRAARTQKVTKDMIEKHQFISNTSLNDLVATYPDLKQYNIPKDLQYSFTLLKCRTLEFGGTTYKGRTVDSKGNEIFVINNFWDAERLFKHLSTKLNLVKFVQGNDVHERLEPYKEDLQVIASRHHKNIQQLLEDFLINKTAYKAFKLGNRIYNPTHTINQVLSLVSGEVYDEGDKSALQIDLESIREKTSTSSEWIFEKKRLYDVLSSFFEQFKNEFTFERFKELDADTLNSVLTRLFSDDIKLIKATVKTETKGERVIKDSTPKTKRERVKSEVIQQYYEQKFLPKNPDLPKKYQEAAKMMGYKFNDFWGNDPIIVTGTDGKTYEAFIEMDENFKVKAYYEVEAAPEVKEKSSYITLSLNNGRSIGDVYGFGYSDQPLFSPTEKYKGFYIYEYHKNGNTHYAISRSIISPNAWMKTFSSLDYAKQFIDNDKDTLRECGLWSIKQTTSRPRSVELEMNHIREGMIITTLDLKLPNKDINSFPGWVKGLLDGTINDFHKSLNFIPNITSLDSPEKSVAFIYLTSELVKKGDDYIKVLKTKTGEVQAVIDKINNADTVSYLIEKKITYKDNTNKSVTKYLLKLLQNNGTNVDIDGKIGDLTIQDFIDQNMNSVIEYFNTNFGIGIKAITRSELELMSKENNLKLEGKLDIVKAFVYNGQIYINTSNADAQDLFHELSHIFLGVLKVQDLQAYEEVVNSYMTHDNYKKQFNYRRKTYKHYSEQDVIEETIADMIALDMFKARQLGTSDFVGEEFLQKFEEILKKSERFTKTMYDNGLGFSRYMRTLLDENMPKVQRNMRISDLVQRLIQEGKIKENC